MIVGAVRELRRYPVKSMLGETVRAATVTERGLDGDRRLALLDLATGKVASAKQPRLWRELLTDRAARALRSARVGAVADELSDLLGRTVLLTDQPPADATLDRARPEEVLSAGPEAEVAHDVSRLRAGTFFDFAPLHLVSTATLARVGAEAARYRPNVVVEVPGQGFVENAWVGRELTIGQELRLQVVAPTPRCAIPTLPHGALPAHPEALRIPARDNRLVPLPGMAEFPCAGVYAQILAPGRVAEGDQVCLVS
ncbi:MOSC domain-containing protein [Kitasatospora azatica]|uniref:MOSC domain-containing protein n=1 Tax=Kitasatospora azatica TaxID=58347 RepID=UPI00055AF120|nr:MOSC N-terminal beta barrel domain-containing protein [Kitasatospora azatica]